MPQEPKKRHSRQRKGKRRASIHFVLPKTVICKNCANVTLPHNVCKSCGYYDGKSVIALSARKEQKATETTSA